MGGVGLVFVLWVLGGGDVFGVYVYDWWVVVVYVGYGVDVD